MTIIQDQNGRACIAEKLPEPKVDKTAEMNKLREKQKLQKQEIRKIAEAEKNHSRQLQRAPDGVLGPAGRQRPR